ncbi:hypothetical protein WAH92_20590, partial [Acinetobacter baumannii]
HEVGVKEEDFHPLCEFSQYKKAVGGRLITFFAAKDGEALYRQQKQDRELTVAQIMSSLLQISGLSWRKQGKPLGCSGMM